MSDCVSCSPVRINVFSFGTHSGSRSCVIDGVNCSRLASVRLIKPENIFLPIGFGRDTQATSRAMLGDSESFHPFITEVRPHDRQKEAARNILTLLSGSYLAQGIRSGRDKNKKGLAQDRYALRSVSQWIGPQLEDLLLADRQVVTELNSSADNLIVDVDRGEIYYGANFHASSITSAMEKTRLSLQMFGKLLFAQSTELINPDLSNEGVDISMAAYFSELAYLANPVSTHSQPAEMHNQSINSLAFLSARMTMQSVEVVYLMRACALYINCQALDLRVMNMNFLSKVQPLLNLITSECLGQMLSVQEIDKLNLSLWEQFEARWASSSRLDAPERCSAAVDSCLATILSTMSRIRSELSTTTNALDIWRLRAAKTAEQAFRAVQNAFFEQQDTQNYLGVGSRSLYLAIRRDLQVPFHQGFVEDPTVEDALVNPLNGRQKKSVGSWISIIYEALRDGQLHKEVLVALGRPTDICTIVNGLDGTHPPSS